ncbi:hypothetical protein MNBD_GAMMA05-2012 [hydrothermal vent metagenome]|uniref:histidine kinase n=1 Tax=hydrothermal vent metagenome TaxID=652676 RepID=A0A3B0X7P2_9ZZZZ
MKLGTRLIIVSSIFLVTLPVLGYYFVDKIQSSLLQGQEDAQVMTASAIATVVRGYTNLFDTDENALYVYPRQFDLSIDGYGQSDEDWGVLENKFNATTKNKFSQLLLGDDRSLYIYLKVKDDNIVYRNPRYIPLDSSDHIRLEYLDNNNQHQRLILLTEGQGRVSVYKVKKDWQTWVNGRHMNATFGVWRETTSGYDVELRLPVEWLQSRRMSISVVDVYGEDERYPDTIYSTKVLDADLLNPVLFRSKEINSAIENFTDSSTQICIIDRYRRVRAVIGGKNRPNSLCQSTDKVSNELVNKVLNGSIETSRVVKGDKTLLIAAHPVFENSKTVGAVLVSNSNSQILSRQRNTLLTVLFTSLALAFLVFMSLLLFSSWLTFRINRLNVQASSIIDDRGRFINNVGLSDTKQKDEIGELSRGFTRLLDKLNNYTGFLESVPSMLRHEILNPVNTISMSLQTLSEEKGRSSRHIDSVDIANKAILQLQLIVSSLTEAANIDEALTQDETDTFDIAALIEEYVSNTRLKHPGFKFVYKGVGQNVFVKGNDIRIVQLLDKIKDNALDFSLPGTDIVFQLDMGQHRQLEIRVKNEGDFIPQAQLDVLFQGMVSRRSVKTNTPHLGIGMYVSYKIAKYHQGHLKITNRRDKQGVEVVLVLPVAN